MRRNRISESDRFWSKVRPDPTGCWLWTGPMTTCGYGKFSVGRARQPRAHRYAYEAHYGPIPNGLWVCHKCDVKARVRPDHLFAGTARENNIDTVVKQRRSLRLNPCKVREIRKRRGSGESLLTIAADFGVTRAMISEVTLRKSWAHVQ